MIYSKRRNRLHSISVTTALYLTAILPSYCLSDAFAQDCVTGYTMVKFPPLAKPEYSNQTQVCKEKIDREVLKNIHFLESSPPALFGERATAILEIRSPSREVLHILRSGISYGEFVDETLNEERGHLKSETLSLKNPPHFSIQSLQELAYIQTIDEYLWEDRRVKNVKRKQRIVHLHRGGEINSSNPWEESTIVRRVTHLQIKRKPTNKDSLHIATLYYDPFVQRFEPFRKFSEIKGRTTTVVPFVKGKDGVSFPAMIEIRGEKKIYQKLKIEDSGQEPMELVISLE